MVKVGLYDYELSNKKGKKLMVVVKGKTIHFGDVNYKHFNDKTGLLDKDLNHNDRKRQENYLKRSKAIKDKKGNLTYKNPLSANYHAVKILWS